LKIIPKQKSTNILNSMIKYTTRKLKYFLCILLVYVLISWINPHLPLRPQGSRIYTYTCIYAYKIHKLYNKIFKKEWNTHFQSYYKHFHYNKQTQGHLSHSPECQCAISWDPQLLYIYIYTKMYFYNLVIVNCILCVFVFFQNSVICWKNSPNSKS
jgi:hypothetical protein